LFDNLLTASPRLLIQLNTVATIPNTVQEKSCNDLPPLLLMVHTVMLFSRQTCHGSTVDRFNCIPIRS